MDQEGRADLSEVLSRDEVKNLSRFYIVACGSSYHVGVVTKYNLEKLARIPVGSCSPRVPLLQPDHRQKHPRRLHQPVRRDGGYARAVRRAVVGALTLAIVNVEGSSIARESDRVILTKAGPEIAVATTKAYSTQLAVTVLLALYAADCCGTLEKTEYDVILNELLAVPDKMKQILSDKENIQRIAYQCFDNEDIFFIGRNIDYALSLEGSLKLKEISYIHSEAYAAGELKHGTISLVVKDTLVIAVASYGLLVDKTLSNAKEVQARGGHIMGITTRACASASPP